MSRAVSILAVAAFILTRPQVSVAAAGPALDLSACLASAGGSDAAWVQPRPEELTRIIGVRWKAKISEQKLLVASPEEWTAPYISQDQARVYAANGVGLLQARSLATGELLWARPDLGSIGASIVEFRGDVVVGSGSNLLFLSNETGKETGRVDLTASIGGKIALAGTQAIVPVRPNAFVAVDLEKRTVMWRTKRATPDGITLRGHATPAIDSARARVYLGFSDGTLAALALTEGNELWNVALGKPGEGFADVDTEPQLVDNNRAIVVASYAGGLAKIDVESGKILWRKDDLDRITGLTSTGGNGLLVATHGDGQVLGLSPESGAVRWRYRFKGGWVTEPVFLGGALCAVFGSEDPLAILDVTTGRPVQLIAVGSGGSVAPAWRSPDLVLMSNKGLVLALQKGGGSSSSKGL